MTAQIVYHGDREPIRSDAVKLATASGMPELHALGGNAPGQLWERLSDATLNADALTESQWSRIAIERNYMGTRRPGIDGDARGSAARRTNDSLSYAASGSISQGRLQYSHLNARPDSIFWGLTTIDDE
jgi:outer membrane protein TolC